MPEFQASEGKELDLGKLLSVFLRYIWLIALFACAGFIAARIYITNFTPNLYTASATMYVYLNNPNQVNYQYTSQSDLNTAARLMETYMVVIRSSKVMDAVAERLGPEYSADFIARTISVGSVGGTEVMRVNSTTPVPELSMAICNAVAEFAPAEIIRVVNAGSVEVIDYATLPEQPNDKGLLTKSLIGAFAGALLICGTLTLEVMFDDRIYKESDLTKAFDIPVLISVPHVKRRALFSFDDYRHLKGKGVRKKRKTGDGSPAAKDENAPGGDGAAHKKTARRSASSGMDRATCSFLFKTPPLIVEVYKRLRVNLSFALNGQPNNAVIVTSPVPAEGKSTTSSNLAIAASQVYSSVLLIDADMRKIKHSGRSAPGVAGHGLSTVLQGVDSFDKAVLRNVCKGLDLLPSGPLPPNPTELLDSARMKELLSRVRSQYSLIIIDTPPVNMVADALALSGQVAGAVCVTRARLSTLKDVEEAVDAVAFTRMPVLGFVLTDARSLRGKAYYKRNKYYAKYKAGYRRAASSQPAPISPERKTETEPNDGDAPSKANGEHTA